MAVYPVAAGVPFEVSVKLNAVPTRAPGAVLALVMAGAEGAGLITMVSEAVVEPPALVAVSVIGNEPFCVGVPLMTPVAGVNVRPLGSAPVEL